MEEIERKGSVHPQVLLEMFSNEYNQEDVRKAIKH